MVATKVIIKTLQHKIKKCVIVFTDIVAIIEPMRVYTCIYT